MSSSQMQGSGAQQQYPWPLHDRAAGESVEQDKNPRQRQSSVSSMERNETDLSHYLHYEDNACFFAPVGQTRDAVGRQSPQIAQP
ncbi:hypothetical protein BDV18DRAFT_95119 [Aspergillus unguis]